MKYSLIIFFCVFTPGCGAQKPAGYKKEQVPVTKLTGTWIMQKRNGEITGETWVKINDSSLSGKSFWVKAGDTTLLETVDIVKEANDIYYIPVVSGQNEDRPVRFKLSGIKGTAYIFENQEHDFPKRIVYDFTGTKTLHAYIDDGTEKKRRHYYYKRKP